MPARDAWLACGEPRGKAGIQNIRKRARAVISMRSRPAQESTSPATSAPGPSSARKSSRVVQAVEQVESRGSQKKALYRLRPSQVQRRDEDREKVRAQFDRVYAAATVEWRRMVQTGACGKGANSADGVASRFSEQLPVDCPHKITGRSLTNALALGRVGLPKGKPGPKAAIPSTFVTSVAEYAQMQQIAGIEQKPRQLVQIAVAGCAGTAYEEHMQTQSQRAAVLRRVRQEMGMGVSTSTVIDDRRWLWLTSTNLTTWFKAYIKTLFDWGFIPYIPADVFEEIIIAAERAQRMGNGDESHQKLSNTGETAGPRAHVYVNLALGRAGKRKYEYQKHASILVWLNYAGEVGAPHL